MAAVVCEVPPAGASVAEQFEYVYRRYQGEIRAVMFAKTRDSALAEDLTADMFARLWADMASGVCRPERIDKLFGFLKVRAGWAISRYYTRHAPRATPIDLDESTADVPCPEQVDDLVCERLRICRLLSVLTESERRTVVLKLMGDLTYDQIAEHYGVPQLAAQGQLVCALAVLRRELGAPAPAGVDRALSDTPGKVDTGAARERREAALTQLREELTAGQYTTLPTMWSMRRRFKLAERSLCLVLSTLVGEGLLARTPAGRYHLPTQPAPAAPVNRRANATRALVTRIYSGELKPGTPLPSIRALGQHVGLPHTTTARMLAELVDRGLLTVTPERRYAVAGVA